MNANGGHRHAGDRDRTGNSEDEFMIAYVKGTLEIIETDAAVVDVHGVGYRVFTPISEKLIRIGIGGDIQLYTYMSVREDAQVLYGFLETEALELFKQLISVNGVGPKLGLQILSAVSAQDLILAIVRDDKKALTKVPGIGAKTAARIVLDLKDKVQASAGASEADSGFSPAVAPAAGGPAQEAVMALTSLGYTQTEAERAVSKVAQDGMSVEEILRQSLKQLY